MKTSWDINDETIYIDKLEKDYTNEFGLKEQVRNSFIEYFKNLGYKVEETRLYVGDINYKNICFERKLIGDFIKSVQIKHMKDQCIKMKQTFPYNYIMIEGTMEKWIEDMTVQGRYHKKSWTRKHFNGAVATIEARYGIRIPPTQPSHLWTWDQIHRIIKKTDDKTEIDINPLFSEKRDTYVESVLSCIPKMGPEKAKTILKEMTFEEIMYCKKEDLLKFHGVGDKYADLILQHMEKLKIEMVNL